ncbi:hypothetical protein [Krasilnikovia sp. MM14-A1259]|uniref:hypothetical protein n=1 Tax=Krasilnikovia sp. MM14-A1259 TaxID=3373539 RepID=UPI00399C88F7
MGSADGARGWWARGWWARLEAIGLPAAEAAVLARTLPPLTGAWTEPEASGPDQK